VIFDLTTGDRELRARRRSGNVVCAAVVDVYGTGKLLEPSRSYSLADKTQHAEQETQLLAGMRKTVSHAAPMVLVVGVCGYAGRSKTGPSQQFLSALRDEFQASELPDTREPWILVVHAGKAWTWRTEPNKVLRVTFSVTGRTAADFVVNCVETPPKMPRSDTVALDLPLGQAVGAKKLLADQPGGGTPVSLKEIQEVAGKPAQALDSGEPPAKKPKTGAGGGVFVPLARKVAPPPLRDAAESQPESGAGSTRVPQGESQDAGGQASTPGGSPAAEDPAAASQQPTTDDTDDTVVTLEGGMQVSLSSLFPGWEKYQKELAAGFAFTRLAGTPSQDTDYDEFILAAT